LIVEKLERDVLMRVSRRRQRPQLQPPKVDLVPIRQAPVRELSPAGTRGQHHRSAVGRQLDRAAEEVGVQMSVGCVGDPQAAALGSGS
jgi:hypothetical protein